ncbi:hypothetical protein HGRIS_009828 [Hohenbuehelia grisea]|uniref:Uncharacterized protein n=1 Tax=Hohenbuehelia grisea TaxID=104357 RepID=A0ABR3J2D0_9AGAR
MARHRRGHYALDGEDAGSAVVPRAGSGEEAAHVNAEYQWRIVMLQPPRKKWMFILINNEEVEIPGDESETDSEAGSRTFCSIAEGGGHRDEVEQLDGGLLSPA